MIMGDDHQACDLLIVGTKKPPCWCRAAKIFDQGSNTRFLQRIGCVFRGFGFVVVLLS